LAGWLPCSENGEHLARLAALAAVVTARLKVIAGATLCSTTAAVFSQHGAQALNNSCCSTCVLSPCFPLYLVAAAAAAMSVECFVSFWCLFGPCGR
jgi:hypothetical protein